MKKKILYISDAKHDPEFEKKEYNLISKNLIKNSIIISDNELTLSEFSILNNKKSYVLLNRFQNIGIVVLNAQLVTIN